MTATDTAPAPDADTAESATPAAPTPAGLAGIVGSADHKVVGRLYIGFSLALLLVALVAGLLVGVERVATDTSEVLDGDTFFQVFTLYRVAGVFLFLWPLLVGLALVVVPLQVGASTVAFPRAAAASFWGWLVGSGLVLGAYAGNGGPGGGEADLVDLFVLGLALVIVSLLLASVCLVTTVTTLRAEGMTLRQLPIFSWSVFAGATVWLLSFPVLLANLAVFYVDHRHGGRLEFGTNVSLFPQMAWALSPPQIFALAVPCLGIIGEIVPTFARSRPRSHGGAQAAIGLAAILSYGAVVQPFFAPAATDDAFYVMVGLAGVLPYLALFGLWALVLKPSKDQERPQVDSPLHFAVLGLAMLLAGVVAAAVRVIDVLDLVGTSFDAAVYNYAIFGGAIVAFGGIAFWGPKIWGGRLGEASGRISALLLFVGTIVLCVPDLWSGLLDQPDVLEPGTAVRDGVQVLNGVSIAGLGLLTLGVLVFAFGLLRAVRKGPDADAADPWEGHTLEWATASPPAFANFTDPLPAIESDRPLLDARAEGEES